ncbi:uncharacterized protein Bfra_011010 [Botrytis fragariae]|uniref:Uncharacterized protein n=1 Tax=Botrytis fragariae TaxID=1964551 RepID=A0A8H6AM73_9HELO|nr:uncharacterized protein Bfra_011010 [Botrytis fragariae]KAF5869810.1 hypothetical protein Bfra_011010 [Botrytis fragariae]
MHVNGNVLPVISTITLQNGLSSPEILVEDSASLQFPISAASAPSPHITFTGLFWKCARIGERLSPYISVCCVVMAVSCTLLG